MITNCPVCQKVLLYNDIYYTENGIIDIQCPTKSHSFHWRMYQKPQTSLLRRTDTDMLWIEDYKTRVAVSYSVVEQTLTFTYKYKETLRVPKTLSSPEELLEQYHLFLSSLTFL